MALGSHPFRLSLLLLALTIMILARIASSSTTGSHTPASSSVIHSDSVLVALLDSSYTDFSELVEKASLLKMLEEVIGNSNITILVPKNAFLEKNLDTDFKKFLMEPGNIKALQKLLLFHVVPRRITAPDWSKESYITLSADSVHFTTDGKKLRVDLANVIAPDAIVRPDGIVHGIDGLLIPKGVQDSYIAWKKGDLTAVLPESAPDLDSLLLDSLLARKTKHSSKTPDPPSPSSWFYAMAPGPSLAPAPAPGPSSGHRWFDGESEVADFISTLVHYGGYNEIADLLVNLTSLAPELAKLVSEGYRITVLAPNDEAMSKLTAEHLTAQGAPEQIIYYHILTEYQTEESFYNAVRRFGRVLYETLRVPYKVGAQEADGTVQFGEGKDAAHLYDHDIYIDGRISVQGIDKVLVPPEEKKSGSSTSEDMKNHSLKGSKGRGLLEGTTEEVVVLTRGRGWLNGALCPFLTWLGKGSQYSSCQ